LAVACAIPTIEIALQTLRDVTVLHTTKKNNDALAKSVSGGLAGVISLGLLALNPFSYSTALGVAGFVAYSIFTGHEKDAYISSKIVYKTLKTCAETLEPLIRGVLEAVEKVWSNFIAPAAIALKDLVVSILNIVPLPKHPVWYVAAGVVTLSALAFTGNLPQFRLQSPIVFNP
jgi:hypothetical protein